MTIGLDQLVVWLVIGAIAGYIAGIFVRGRRQGLIVSAAVGLIGALIGGLLFNLLNVPELFVIPLSGRDLFAAILGAMIFLFLLRAMRPRLF